MVFDKLTLDVAWHTAASDTSHQPIPKQIEALRDVRITQVASGSKHSIALDADGAIYTW
jgi:alpha-tubulin suppressor-like RCC1 family protein